MADVVPERARVLTPDPLRVLVLRLLTLPPAELQEIGRNLTREGLITALESLKGFDTGIVPPMTIGPDHDTQKQGFWVRVEKGHFKPLSDWIKSDP